MQRGEKEEKRKTESIGRKEENSLKYFCYSVALLSKTKA